MNQMKKRLISILLLLFFFVSDACATGFTQNGDQIEEAAKSVLKLFVYEKENAADDEYAATASGFVAFSGTMLITNYHVIDGAVEIWAVDDLDNVYQLKYVLAADEKSDIAILEFLKPTGLQPLVLYPDGNLKRGNQVAAIGSPKGLKNTVSTGIVSSVFEEDGIPYIQTTAPISPGSSGGALFNDDGKVIGVTTSAYTSKDEFGEDTEAQNINFAVNIAVAQAMYNAWDGTRYSFKDHISSAKMDYTGVYKTGEAVETAVPDEGIRRPGEKEPENTAETTWTCSVCGTVNTGRFCQECGSEKPNWICACGELNNGKFCTSCGRKAEDLVAEFDSAIDCVSEKKFDEAVRMLESLGEFDSGSFETEEGSHSVAKDYIATVYYQKGIALVAAGGEHEEILDCFKKAGDYSDSQNQIKAENDRYSAAYYADATKEFEAENYLVAIDLYSKAGNYSDATERIREAYYLYGVGLLNGKKWDACREAFEKADGYDDSAMMILRSYYEEGNEWYDKGEYDKAIECFSKAETYPGAKDTIWKYYYALGKEAMQNKEMKDAAGYFEKVGKYEDAELLLRLANIGIIEQNFEENKQYSINPEDFTGYLDELIPFMDLEIAQTLNKEISYYIADRCKAIGEYQKAAQYYKMADDYLDSFDNMKQMLCKQCKSFVIFQMNDELIKYYHDNIEPYDLGQEMIVLKPNDAGNAPKYLLNLIRTMQLGKIPQDERVYGSEYEEDVKSLEKYFGMTVDGKISVDEYVYLLELINKGSSGDRVQQLVEKLYDLGYLKTLDKDHTVYANGYFNGIKNAEKELELNVDGVVTPEEFKIIMLEEAEITKPENLKALINKDVATITWSRVPGAILYEVYENTENGREKLGETKECRWVQKDIKTGATKNYVVVAKKYTVESEESIAVDSKLYYKPVTVTELIDNLSILSGKDVFIKGLKVKDWKVKYEDKEYPSSRSMVDTASVTPNYDAYILCYANNDYVEVVMKNYNSWYWDCNVLLVFDKINSLSVGGVVQTEGSMWDEYGTVPSIEAKSVEYSKK